MEREGGFGPGVEQAVLDHMARAVEALFARLEHEAHLPCHIFVPPRQYARRACEHRGVRVVSAGMHATGNGGGEFESGVLIHGQRVHVAAQQHRATRPAPLEDCHGAGSRCPLAPGQWQVGQFGAHLGQRERGFQP